MSWKIGDKFWKFWKLLKIYGRKKSTLNETKAHTPTIQKILDGFEFRGVNAGREKWDGGAKYFSHVVEASAVQRILFD